MKNISRKEAKAQGLTRYYTGKPCKHGHITERAISGGNCTECAKQTNKNWKKKNPEANNIIHKKAANKYRQDNKEKIAESSIEYYIKNKKRISVVGKAYRKNNPEKAIKRWHDYLQRKEQAIPQWYEDDLVKQIYLKRDELSKLWGIQLHVDHIVPLQNKNVCGLHCWDNLQILESSINLSKSNKHI